MIQFLSARLSVCLYLTLSLSASLTLVVYSLGLFSLFDQFPLDGAWIIDCQTSLSYSVSNRYNCSSYTYTAPPAVQVMELIYHGVFMILCYLSIFHTERALYRKLAKYDEHPVIIWHHEIKVTRMQFMTLFNNISSIFLGRQKMISWKLYWFIYDHHCTLINYDFVSGRDQRHCYFIRLEIRIPCARVNACLKN